MSVSQIITGFVILAGVFLFGGWLLKTSLGKNALTDSRPRRNNLRPYAPLIPLIVWFGPIPVAIQIAGELAADLPDWQRALLFNLIYCLGSVVVIAVMIFLVRSGFARRLKGLGLNLKSIHRDFFVAFINLLSVFPLMMVAIKLTLYFGQLIYGPEYQMPQHEQLELIGTYPQWQLQISTFVVAAVIAPVLEEMLFRGLFQTVIRSVLESRYSELEVRNRAWLSVFMSSGLFAIVHGNVPHWPALFILGVCLGYAYEKSGSLFRPIFIHAFFNAVTIIFVLFEV